MIPVTTFSGKRVALFGLGGSGLATAEALVAGGAEVLAFDDAEASRERARARAIPVGDLREADWSAFAALVLSPGVPLTHPTPHWTVDKARAAGIPVIGDIELFCRERRAHAPKSAFIAITGTNGKSTTTALIAHLLRAAGREVSLGGNIGTAILSLEQPGLGRVHVVECSSYQIDLAPSLDPSVGVLLNVTPDHLDRHGSMEHYAAIKARLVEAADKAVVAIEDDWTRAIAARLEAENQPPVTVSTVGAARYTLDGTSLLHEGEVFADLAGIASLRGRHNAQNALAAAAAVASIGVDHAKIAQGLKSFPGLAHRMEPLGRAGRVLFVNDSKATNADSTEKALSAYPEGVFWILGGKQKAGGIDALNGFFGKIDKAYLIGEATDSFAATLEGRVVYARCGTLETAVTMAADDALASGRDEAVVLLSPACASFDQYPNFEARGEHFRQLAGAWLKAHGGA